MQDCKLHCTTLTLYISSTRLLHKLSCGGGQLFNPETALVQSLCFLWASFHYHQHFSALQCLWVLEEFSQDSWSCQLSQHKWIYFCLDNYLWPLERSYFILKSNSFDFWFLDCSCVVQPLGWKQGGVFKSKWQKYRSFNPRWEGWEQSFPKDWRLDLLAACWPKLFSNRSLLSAYLCATVAPVKGQRSIYAFNPLPLQSIRSYLVWHRFC